MKYENKMEIFKKKILFVNINPKYIYHHSHVSLYIYFIFTSHLKKYKNKRKVRDMIIDMMKKQRNRQGKYGRHENEVEENESITISKLILIFPYHTISHIIFTIHNLLLLSHTSYPIGVYPPIKSLHTMNCLDKNLMFSFDVLFFVLLIKLRHII